MHAAQRYKKQFDESEEREKQLQAKNRVLEERIAEQERKIKAQASSQAGILFKYTELQKKQRGVTTCKKVILIVSKINLFQKLKVWKTVGWEKEANRTNFALGWIL